MPEPEPTAETADNEERDVRHGRPGPRAYRGLGELWDLKDRYLNWKASTGYEANSVRGAHAVLSPFFQHLERLGISRLADVTPEVMEAYAAGLREPRNGLPPAVRYTNTQVIVIQQFFRWAGREGLVLYDPTEDLELPRLPRELPKIILTEDQMERLLAAPDLGSPVGYRDRAILEVFFGAGLRPHSLVRLTVDDLDHGAGTVRVRRGKGGKPGIIPVPGVALAFCREYIKNVRPLFIKERKDDGTLFLTHNGFPLNATRMVEIFKRCRGSAGLDLHVTAKVIRDTVATMMLESGMDSRFVQEFLQHEKLSTTQIYMRVTMKGLRKNYDAAHPLERAARRGARRCQGQKSDKK